MWLWSPLLRSTVGSGHYPTIAQSNEVRFIVGTGDLNVRMGATRESRIWLLELKPLRTSHLGTPVVRRSAPGPPHRLVQQAARHRESFIGQRCPVGHRGPRESPTTSSKHLPVLDPPQRTTIPRCP